MAKLIGYNAADVNHILTAPIHIGPNIKYIYIHKKKRKKKENKKEEERNM